MGNSNHISYRMDLTHWDDFIYPELVKRQVPNKLLFLKSKTGRYLIFHSVLTVPKV